MTPTQRKALLFARRACRNEAARWPKGEQAWNDFRSAERAIDRLLRPSKKEVEP